MIVVLPNTRELSITRICVEYSICSDEDIIGHHAHVLVYRLH